MEPFRPWEVCGTRHVPDWEREILERFPLIPRTGPEPSFASLTMRRGLCANRDDHEPHKHTSTTLGDFWCTADQDEREPYRSERRRRRD
jgi:hypothetical protein